MNTTVDDRSTPQRGSSSRTEAQALRQRFDERLAAEGVYIADAHVTLVAQACVRLCEAHCIAFTSNNYALAQHNKELCIGRLRADKQVQLLFFDPLSGPDLLAVINAELENVSLDNVVPKLQQPEVPRTPSKVLIVDNEDLVSNADWDLIAALGSQLKGAGLGVLTLLPQDLRAGSPLLADSISIERCEFLVPSERECAFAQVIARHSSRGAEVVAKFESLGLLAEDALGVEGSVEPVSSESEAEEHPSMGERPVSAKAPHNAASNNTAHLSFRLFLGLLIVELLVLFAMSAF